MSRRKNKSDLRGKGVEELVSRAERGLDFILTIPQNQDILVLVINDPVSLNPVTTFQS
jgi:hypothetical protein